jgi:transposase
VVEELERSGCEAKLAEPADTRAMRAKKKKRAKTDRLDAPHLRELVCQGRLPESWLPPSGIQEDLRTLLRMRKTLVDERTAFLQRIHAQLFHHDILRRSATCSRQGSPGVA